MRELEQLTLNQEKLNHATALLRAITHPLRLRILEYLDQQDRVNVNKIYHALQLEQSITSQHLRILRDADLVMTHRQGKYIYYQVNYEQVDAAKTAVDHFLGQPLVS